MNPSKQHGKQHTPVATPTETLETGVPEPVPKSPKRKRIPTVTTSLLGAALSASTPETPASTVATVTSATSTPTTTFAGTVNPPPAVQLPVPPLGFTPPEPREYAGFYPTIGELEAAPQVITDLQSFTNYAQLLGSGVPVADEAVQAIQIGIQWRAMRAPAETWDTYVRAQYGAAWKVALTLLDEIKPAFLLAAAKDPSLVLKYPGMAKMFAAPKQVATKGVATKKKNAKAKASAAGPAALAASASTEATAPTKSVTVTV